VAKGNRYKSFTVRPSDGGTLAPALSEDLSQNPSNYEVKLNFRREHDFEVRREGWEFYKPFSDVVLIPTDFPDYWSDDKTKRLKRRLRGQCLASPDPIEAISQYESGRRVTVAGTPTSIYVLNGEMRNTVSDSLRYFDVVVSSDPGEEEWHYEPSEQNINQFPGKGYYVETYEDASQNYLWSDRQDLDDVLGDVDGWTNITPDDYKFDRLTGRYRNLLEKDELTAEESESLESLQVLEGEKRGFSPGDRMEIDYLNGYVIFNNSRNLPAIYHSDWEKAYPIYELREKGVVSVGTVAQYEGYLLLGNILEFDTDADLELWGAECEEQDGPNFYGSVEDSNLYKAGRIRLRRVSYRILYSNLSAPHRWGFAMKSKDMGTDDPNSGLGTKIFKPIFQISAEAGTNRLSGTFSPGTRVVIDMATSDGSQGTPIEATVLKYEAGAYELDEVIEWLAPEGSAPDTTSGVTGYMRRVNNVDDSSTPFANVSNWIDPVGDGSAIVNLTRLRDRLVIFRDTGYALLSTVNTEASLRQSPFTYELRYSGSRVPMHSKATVVVNDQRILYAGHEDIYSISASYSEPSIPALIDYAKEFGYGDTVFLSDNALTGEVFICGTEKTLAFDYKYDTVSEIDAVFSCGGMIRDPVSGLDVYLLGTRAQVELPGLEDPSGGYFHRSHALFKYSYDQASDLEHGELGNIPQVYTPDGARRYVREVAVGGIVYSSDTPEVKVTYDSVLESGWIDLSRRLDEKDFRMYLLDFHADPASVFMRESSDLSDTETSRLPLYLPFSLAALTFPTYTENRLAVSDLQEHEVDQEPDHRIIVEPAFLVNVKLFSKDTMGGVSRIEVDENLTIRDELSIPIWFRSILVKDRLSMKGPDSGKVYSRSMEASLVSTGGRTLSIRR
jgi:hypothetical protein